MEQCVKSIGKMKINNIICSSLIHHDSGFFIEGCQVSQGLFPFHESMLTILKHFCFPAHLQIISRTVGCTQFLRIKIGMTSLYFFQSSFLPFQRQKLHLLPSSPQEFPPNLCDFPEMLDSGLVVTSASSLSTRMLRSQKPLYV